MVLIEFSQRYRIFSIAFDCIFLKNVCTARRVRRRVISHVTSTAVLLVWADDVGPVSAAIVQDWVRRWEAADQLAVVVHVRVHEEANSHGSFHAVQSHQTSGRQRTGRRRYVRSALRFVRRPLVAGKDRIETAGELVQLRRPWRHRQFVRTRGRWIIPSRSDWKIPVHDRQQQAAVVESPVTPGTANSELKSQCGKVASK